MVNFLKDLFKGYDGKLNKNKRKLSDRAHLAIEFPQKDDRVIRTFVPFLENPIIQEKGRARLNTYDLVGRAGQLFSYGGAESRKFSVTFHISLLHLSEMSVDDGVETDVLAKGHGLQRCIVFTLMQALIMNYRDDLRTKFIRDGHTAW